MSPHFCGMISRAAVVYSCQSVRPRKTYLAREVWREIVWSLLTYSCSLEPFCRLEMNFTLFEYVRMTGVPCFTHVSLAVGFLNCQEALHSRVSLGCDANQASSTGF